VFILTPESRVYYGTEDDVRAISEAVVAVVAGDQTLVPAAVHSVKAGEPIFPKAKGL
jgi:hypothetical protein